MPNQKTAADKYAILLFPFHYLIEITVFVSGAVVMIYELAGSRVLAPYVGTSIIVWTSLIGIILGSLSIGYYVGGRVADRNPKIYGLAFLLFVAAILIGFTVISKEFILRSVGETFTDIKTAAVVASIILFAPASVILGTVSPYAIRLKSSSLTRMGTTAGSLYALSTIGSIAGTFLAGFYLVPQFGVSNILVFLAITLLLLSILLAPVQFLYSKVGFMIAFFMFLFVSDSMLSYAAFYPNAKEVNTSYARVFVNETVRNDRPIRELMISNEHSSAMYLDGNDLVYEYTKFYHLARHFKPDLKSALIIGGAGYSFPKDFLRVYPQAKLDVVEIDPGLTTIAKKYFRLEDDPRLTIYHEDGRTYLNRTEKKYDVIFGDAFNSQYSIPFQLTTREAIQRSYDALSDDGVVVLNVISAISGDQGIFLRAEYNTYKKVFPNVVLFPVWSNQNGEQVQNIILVATKNKTLPPLFSQDPEIDAYLKHYYAQAIPDDIPELTDDYAPVDFYISRILRNM